MISKPVPKNLFTLCIAFLYKVAIIIRNILYDRLQFLSRSASRPVISIGSVTAGGAGKTPLALLVAGILCQKDYHIAFLSRGYRRKDKKNIIVQPNSDQSWSAIGDEPALLRNRLQSAWLGIGKNRNKTAQSLSFQMPKKSVFILDDGFQHRKLRRNLDIIALPEKAYYDRLIPFGFLREPFNNINRADIICLIGRSDEREKLEIIKEKITHSTGKSSVFTLFQRALSWINLESGKSAKKPPCKNPTLISGVARPERFILMVEKQGIKATKTIQFADHHEFSADQINGLTDNESDGIITTEKDSIRLRPLKLVNRSVIWYLKIELAFFEDSEKRRFSELIINRLMNA